MQLAAAQFRSSDDIEHIVFGSINGLNLYYYCYKTSISYCESSGNMIIAIVILLTCIVVGLLACGTYAGTIYI